LLLAVYPILALYSQNVSQVPTRDLVLPIVLALGCTALLWWALQRMIRDHAKAALATSVFLFLFYAYGPMYAFFEEFNWFFDLRVVRHIWVAPVFLALWFGATRLVVRTDRRLDVLTPALNVCALTLVGINVISVAAYAARQTLGRRDVQATQVQNEAAPLEDLPDLYFLILDEYAGLKVIDSTYHYDNSEFAEWLRTRGFFVAPASECSYKLSEYSTGSTLNMRLLGQDEDAYEALHRNRKVALLKSQGYAVIQLPMNDNGVFDQADTVLGYEKEYPSTRVKDFHLLLMEKSMLMFAYERFIGQEDFGRMWRDRVRYTLDMMEDLAKAPSPKLVYLHICCPHYPFVFTEDGGAVEVENYYNLKDTRYYVGQYRYITREIKKAIDTILSSSSGPPAVILQSDHGYRGFAPRNMGFHLDVGETWRNVLNAFCFPGKSIEGAHESMAPRETVRLFFTAYGWPASQIPDDGAAVLEESHH
jgi:hypothetical protein